MPDSTAINQGGYGISRKRGVGLESKKETQIQNAIRAELSRVGIVRRNNVGVFITPYGQKIHIGLSGESDLTLFCKNSKTYFIEIKTPCGRQAQNQKNFQKAVENLGFEYIIMRSVDDAKKFLERFSK